MTTLRQIRPANLLLLAIVIGTPVNESIAADPAKRTPRTVVQ